MTLKGILQLSYLIETLFKPSAMEKQQRQKKMWGILDLVPNAYSFSIVENKLLQN